MDAFHDPFAPLTPAEVMTSGPARTGTSGAEPEDWPPVLPAPLPLPESIRHQRYGTPSMVWRYRDAAGRLLFAVARFDKPDGGKDVLPYCCGANGWRWKAPPEPRPLYGLHGLVERPDAPLLVVEGEKAADAAALRFSSHVVVTWQGGSNAVGKADASPLAGRSVTLWPDNDAPGRQAAAAMMKAASAAGAARVGLVDVPATWPDRWDLADPLPDGVGLDTLAAMLAAAEADPAEASPPAGAPSADDVRAVVDRAAAMDGVTYTAARSALAAELPGVGVTALDKLRRAEIARVKAEAREIFDALDDAAALAAEPAGAAPPPHGGERVQWPPGFSMKKAGLFTEADDGTSRIAGPFAVLGRARDAGSNGWGLVLEWRDEDGIRHRQLIPGRLIHAEPGRLETVLHEDGGLYVSPDPGDRMALRDALAGVKTTARVRRASRCGWHSSPGGGAPAYVLPDGSTIGPAAEPVILDGASAELAARCGTAGTLEQWQAEVAARAVGNPAAAFCISAAFAGPLLELAGEPSGGFHLAGPSKIGKTTAAQMGVSVWGRPDKRGALRDWRTTANAMEAALEEASDGLLALDEIAQADPREVESAIYQAGNEGGKGRLRADATARPRRNWRVMILSTGEMTPAQKAAEAGKGLRPGAEVRLPALRFASDAGAMWPALHGSADRTALWRGLHEALRRHHGTAARAFLASLAAARATSEAELQEAVAQVRRSFLADHLPADAPDQARTVALRFALVAAAGEMATDMGVLPWPAGEATSAAAAGFAAWLADRGGATSGEDTAAMQAVRAFIERHGESRFGLIEHDQDGKRTIGGDLRPVPNRAGWRIRPKGGEGWRYLILPEVWRNDVCAGLDPASVARALQRAQHLQGGDGKNLARKEQVPSEGRQMRVYVVFGSILE